MALHRTCFGLLTLLNLLKAWKEVSSCIWRVFYNKEGNMVEVLSDQDSVTLNKPGQHGKGLREKGKLTKICQRETSQL